VLKQGVGETEMGAVHKFSPLSPVPLHMQIRELLRTRIMDGVYKSHAQMPSENEMVRTFGVSRITVRQALADLQKEGLIFRIHGKGTFVSKPKAIQNLRRLEGFGEAMSVSGHETFSKVIGHRAVRAGRVVAERLRISERDEVTELKRIRYLDREPISLDVTYVPISIGERLVREDLVRRDIFAILENDYGIGLGNADLSIEAILADDELASSLRIDAGSPILRIERLTFTADKQPLDFEFLYFRGDAFQYRLCIERRAGAAAATQRALEKAK
jgi:GntR family transcriptional regulator